MIGWARQTMDFVRRDPSGPLFRDAERLQWLSAGELARAQLEQIRALCRHAWATTPYYREVFDDLKIAPEDVRTLADYSHLPVLTKAIIRERLGLR